MDDDLHQWLFCFAPGKPELVREIVAANPLIVETSEGLFGCCACGEEAADVGELRRHFDCEGLSGLLVHSPERARPATLRFDDAVAPVRGSGTPPAAAA